jgi:hypothetical protein
MASRIIMVWSLDELVLDIPQLNGNLCQRMGKLLMLQVRCSCCSLQRRALADDEISVYIIGIDECHVTTKLQVCYSLSFILPCTPANLYSADLPIYTHMQIKVIKEQIYPHIY